ncbi:MAG: 4-alpha-glucanotransferase [Clostridia bacterium]|nr:4-alpha-glucanotransferase [Clostridia bacterium]
MRQSGILLHITSLPSRGGIGTLGRAAYDFVDFVRASGMTIWQMLPIGPTGYAESPYQSTSTFAGNPLMIDFDLLEDEGILPAGSYQPLESLPNVDFEAVKAQKSALLHVAFEASREKLAEEIAAFEKARPWVRDYALFCAVKAGFDHVSWMQWPDQDIRLRRPKAVEKYAKKLAGEVDYYIFEQYLFFRQWEKLHDYARANGVKLMGDMPIYVAEDSCDVWMNPDMFELDEDCRPIRIAGVPPDYFQKDGQRWGNPLYAWKKHAETGYAWWIARLRALGDMFDVLRIDHFIGFANYYAIPAEEPTARVGKYEPGPGRRLFNRVRRELPGLNIVAEDLGVVSAKVRRLLAFCGYPGMKVMQFAFDSDENPDLPKHHIENCIVYTGTHDNNTTQGWWDGASDETKARARALLGMPEDEENVLPWIIRAAFESVADTVIVPMQDWLGLGGEARMNYPGTVGGNWLWRMQPTDLAPIARRIRRLNRQTGRGMMPAASGAALIELAEAQSMMNAHRPLEAASTVQLHDAVAKAAMLDIAPQWTDDYEAHLDGRRAAYLSAEYLMGRLVYNNLYCMGVLDQVKAAAAQKGIDLADLEDIEDAALGNGGLGRLAACFLDSAATHDIPLDGYGLRYRYGLFKQSFDENGAQCEDPDDWTMFGDPWSVRRDDLAQLVEMKGLNVWAVPYDMPVIGYQRKSIGTLRLWQCESVNEFDFDLFNTQNYAAACRDKNGAEDITKVLYPNDTKKAGKLMRLRQQYVLVSASLQDMLNAYRQRHGDDLSRFAGFHAIQLNDTHPTMAIPELIRLLMNEGMSFNRAFGIARRTFRYTNHTVMREALECWDMKLMSELSPRLVQIIRRIQTRLDRDLKKAAVEDATPYAIIDENKRVHMANLAVYASSYTNGVAAIHSQILKDDVFREWYALYPERFNNKTNGITQRRWLGLCNPELTALLKDALGGDGFLTDLYELDNLKPLIDDGLAKRFIEVKAEKKRQLAQLILEREGVEIPPHFVFDVQVKRLHEYKRQLLNALSILDIYYGLKDGTLTDFPATAFIFGAKSAPGYARAKAIIRFINHIAQMVNADPEVSDRLRVVFVQNYNCSYAEHIIPAADISEQISPAGTEASGTGNMKLMLNGAVTLGTYDGANIEIVEQAGEANNFVFGATVDELNAIKDTYDPVPIYEADPGLKKAVDALGDGTFEPADAPMNEGELVELKKSLLEGASWHQPDHYFLLRDYESYKAAKLRAIRATEDKTAFAKMCLYNIAGAGKFSSDRTIEEYWNELWRK